MTAMLRSAQDNLSGNHFLQVVVLDAGIHANTWTMIERSFRGESIKLHRVVPETLEIDGLPSAQDGSLAPYYRLFAGLLTPEHINKIIYLDSDLIVRSDLTELWHQPLDQYYCLAAQDIACPYVDASIAKVNYTKAKPYITDTKPIRNWEALGLDPTAHYFNSGVMVINLKLWRDTCVHEKLLRCLRQNQSFVRYWDQYALNVVFSGKWKELPIHWNQRSAAYDYPNVDTAPIQASAFLRLRNDPAIVHFTSAPKPWRLLGKHPYRDLFFHWLDRTAFIGWRPALSSTPVKHMVIDALRRSFNPFKPVLRRLSII